MNTSGATSLNQIRPAKIIRVNNQLKFVDIMDLLSGRIIENAVISSSAFASNDLSDSGLLWRPPIGARCLYTIVDGIGATVLSFIPEIKYGDNSKDLALATNKPFFSNKNSIGLITDTGEGVVINRKNSVSIIASVASWLKLSKIGRMFIKTKEYIWQWFGGYEKAEISGVSVEWEKAVYAQKYTAKEIAQYISSSQGMVPGVYFQINNGEITILSISSSSKSKLIVKPGQIDLYKNGRLIQKIDDTGITVYGDITLA